MASRPGKLGAMLVDSLNQDPATMSEKVRQRLTLAPTTHWRSRFCAGNGTLRLHAVNKKEKTLKVEIVWATQQ